MALLWDVARTKYMYVDGKDLLGFLISKAHQQLSHLETLKQNKGTIENKKQTP